MRMNYSRVGCSGIIYDGVNVSDTFQIVDVSIPLLPTFEAATHELAQRPGAYYVSRNVGTREIRIKLRLDAENRDPMEIFHQWREVSHIFNKPSPRKLYLDEERYCNAMMVGESEIVNEAYYGVVEFAFMCFDPYFYGRSHSYEVKSGAAVEFKVAGDSAAYPTLELTATTTQVKVTNQATGEFVLVPNTASGAELAIDMERQTATMGGEYAPVTLLSDFFSVDGNASVLIEGASGTMKYVERYL